MDAAVAIIPRISEKMAYNVPAVYDVLTARIKKCVAFFGLENCAVERAWYLCAA
jgi:hypothetical protein